MKNGASENEWLAIQEAANLLNVSLSYMVKLVGNGEMPSFGSGAQCKIFSKDLMAYKQERDEASMALLDELTAEAQEFNLGY